MPRAFGVFPGFFRTSQEACRANIAVQFRPIDGTVADFEVTTFLRRRQQQGWIERQRDAHGPAVFQVKRQPVICDMYRRHVRRRCVIRLHSMPQSICFRVFQESARFHGVRHPGIPCSNSTGQEQAKTLPRDPIYAHARVAVRRVRSCKTQSYIPSRAERSAPRQLTADEPERQVNTFRTVRAPRSVAPPRLAAASSRLFRRERAFARRDRQGNDFTLVHDHFFDMHRWRNRVSRNALWIDRHDPANRAKPERSVAGFHASRLKSPRAFRVFEPVKFAKELAGHEIRFPVHGIVQVLFARSPTTDHHCELAIPTKT